MEAYTDKHYERSTLRDEETVTETLKPIARCLQKKRRTNDFEGIVVTVEYALPDSIAKGFQQDLKVEVIAKLIARLKSGPLRHCKTAKQYFVEGRSFLQSEKGQSWMEDQLRPQKMDFLEDQRLPERVDSAEDQPLHRNVDTKEAPKRKSSEPQAGIPKKPASLTLTMESNPSSSSKELLGVVSTPSPAQSSSSYVTPQEIVSQLVSSPTGSASPTRKTSSPSSNVPGLHSVICAPPAPVQIGGTVIYGPEGSGLCLQCWMIHNKGFGGPFVDLETFDHGQIYLGNDNKEINGQTWRLSASSLVGTVVRVINWLAGSLPRTQ